MCTWKMQKRLDSICSLDPFTMRSKNVHQRSCFKQHQTLVYQNHPILSVNQSFWKIFALFPKNKDYLCVYTLCSDKIMLTKKKWLLFYKWIRKIGIKLPFARVKFCKFILKWSIYLTGFIIPSSLEGAGFFVGVAEKMINQSTCRIPAMTLLIIRKYTV